MFVKENLTQQYLGPLLEKTHFSKEGESSRIVPWVKAEIRVCAWDFLRECSRSRINRFSYLSAFLPDFRSTASQARSQEPSRLKTMGAKSELRSSSSLGEGGFYNSFNY
jgi:hypothetical protein